jgi:hypothetical protein
MKQSVCVLLAFAPVLLTPCAASAGDSRPAATPPPVNLSLRCNTSTISLRPTDYLDIDDGQIDDAAAKALNETFEQWTEKPPDQPLTIAVFFHGGLIDRNCGLQCDDALRPLIARVGATPYFFIYNVGAEEAIKKGNERSGLFNLYDNRAPGLLNHIGRTTRMTDERDEEGRDHGHMTRREDWFRDGMAPLAIVGRFGMLAWAYMNQTVVDGLDRTHPAAIAAPALHEACDSPSTDERDRWPHFHRAYDVERAGGRAFLCRLQILLERRTAPTHIVLVGHSTGAIYITQFIRKAQRLWSEGPAAKQRFDVVFLAPAVTYETFYDMVSEAGPRVHDLRIFTMDDRAEQSDYLLYQLLSRRTRPLATYYERSLLYLVSGVFEPEPDMPLVGMMRFQDAARVLRTHPANARDIWFIDAVSNWMIAFGGAHVVFTQSPSPPNTPFPFAACEVHHGDFGDARSVAMQAVAVLIADDVAGTPWPRTYVPGAPAPAPCLGRKAPSLLLTPP